MEDTPKLKLPYLIAAQAQKHVTHNEALRALDVVVQLSVADRDLASPPASPTDGERYIVATPSADAWAGKDGQIAAWQDNAWMFYAPNEGWLAWVADEDSLYVFDGAGWIAYASGLTSVNPVSLVGVNATADATNKLTVKSDAVLFSHDDVTPGNGSIQHKLNKAAAANTASFLFQNNWSGRAEIGLTGDDDFHFKVSADGSAWTDALVIDDATGNVGVRTTPQTGAGAFRSGGAMQCKMEANAFGCTSVYSAFVLGETGHAPTGGAGGLYAIARKVAGNEPFTGLCGWDNGTTRVLYFGGGGWSVPDATAISFYTAPAYSETNNTGLLRLQVRSDGTTVPGADNAYSLGNSSYRWSQIYAANATINTSDAREKLNVTDSLLGLDFVMSLRPVSFRWVNGGNRVEIVETVEATPGESREVLVPQTGSRTHYGLIAQEVKAALDAAGVDDAAFWTLADKNDLDSRQGLRYEELIAPLIKAVQELAARVDELQS